ncbi:flavin reductase family protein [Bradyrhizobium sp.]|uniref:flavin reductase family protein n=1 Tax=Bradyrhizobium sp. TaxID=376 RepID=UPI0039E54AAA
MDIDPNTRTLDETYKLITGMIVPRPVAWITSLSSNGAVNLAPFSAYGLVTHSPPMLMVTIGKRDGERKDTGKNILERGEFVVNVARYDDATMLHGSSADFAYGESEISHLGLETVPSAVVSVPRLATSVAAMECRLREKLEYPDVDSIILLGQVVSFHVRDDLMHGGKIDTRELDPLGRIGGPNYAGLDRFIGLAPPSRQAATSVREPK